MWYREREREERGVERGLGGQRRISGSAFLLFFFFFYYLFFSLFFLFLLHENQSPGSIHSKDTQMLVARDDSVKIHRQLFVAGI